MCAVFCSIAEALSRVQSRARCIFGCSQLESCGVSSVPRVCARLRRAGCSLFAGEREKACWDYYWNRNLAATWLLYVYCTVCGRSVAIYIYVYWNIWDISLEKDEYIDEFGSVIWVGVILQWWMELCSRGLYTVTLICDIIRFYHRVGWAVNNRPVV